MPLAPSCRPDRKVIQAFGPEQARSVRGPCAGPEDQRQAHPRVVYWERELRRRTPRHPGRSHPGHEPEPVCGPVRETGTCAPTCISSIDSPRAASPGAPHQALERCANRAALWASTRLGLGQLRANGLWASWGCYRPGQSLALCSGGRCMAGGTPARVSGRRMVCSCWVVSSPFSMTRSATFRPVSRASWASAVAAT
jgi:hypothetical protein